MTDVRGDQRVRPGPGDGPGPGERAGRGDRTDWRERAACREADPELFFPVGNAGPALGQVAQAKRICAGCAVRARCLEWALASGQEAGVWGGTSEEERQVLRRMRRKAQVSEVIR